MFGKYQPKTDKDGRIYSNFENKPSRVKSFFFNLLENFENVFTLYVCRKSYFEILRLVNNLGYSHHFYVV